MARSMTPTIGRIVWYRTDGRNGFNYDLPAMIVTTEATHAGPVKPNGMKNLLAIPKTEEEGEVHLVVFTPGEGPHSAASYVEHSVPMTMDYENPPARSWRWPELS